MSKIDRRGNVENVKTKLNGVGDPCNFCVNSSINEQLWPKTHVLSKNGKKLLSSCRVLVALCFKNNLSPTHYKIALTRETHKYFCENDPRAFYEP